jgi:class 3 adenylate cyclase
MSALRNALAGFRRNKSLVNAVGAAAIALAMALAALAAVNNIAFLTGAERFVQDWEIAFESPPADQDTDILILAVNENTLRMFPYRSPVDRGFLARLLTDLDAKHPRAIGLDFLFDQPTEPAKDAALRKVLRTIKTPLVVSYLAAGDIVADRQEAYLESFVPPRERAFANIGTDQTDTVRWIWPGAKDAQGHYIPSFPRALAALAGVHTPPITQPIVWHGDRGSEKPAFSEIPAHVEGVPSLTMAALLPAAVIRGRIVLIGSDLTLVDRHRTPFATNPRSDQATMPGIVIQAHALSQLLNHSRTPQLGWWGDFLVTLLLALLGAGLGLSGRPLLLRLGAVAALIVLLWVLGVFVLFPHASVMIALIAPSIASMASFAAVDSAAGREARRQRAFIQGAFSRYVSPKLVEQMVEDPSRMGLEGERRLMTYLFSDIENFTTMSEKLESKELARLLNAYLDGMTAIILRYDGMVDKFIGDAVFAIFNAPIDLPDHARKAVQCMLALDDFTERFRQEEQARGIALGRTRIGVHTGVAVIGNFGSQARFTYTAQGDAVNTASRLEGFNKFIGTRLCVSGATRALCPGMAFRPVASVVLKGKTEALALWEPLHEGAFSTQFLDAYRTAYDHLAEGQADAASLFAALLAEQPADPCVRFHEARLRSGEHGVEMVMTEK